MVQQINLQLQIWRCAQELSFIARLIIFGTVAITVAATLSLSKVGVDLEKSVFFYKEGQKVEI